MPATPALRRTLAVLAALPLLALAACGYGSQAKDNAEQAIAGAAKVDGLDSVKIGYFGNLTHATALVGRHEGCSRRSSAARWRGTPRSTPVRRRSRR